MPPAKLNPEQQSALLDVLSHAEVYAEIRDFRQPGVLSRYGPPFTETNSEPSSSPSLQALVSRFVLTLPGLRDVSKRFWHDRVYAIIEDFEKAELSESYDKGNLGIRKTLATAVSALIEYPVRGVFAGLERPTSDNGYVDYDTSNSEELAKAFRDCIQGMVYGEILDDMIAKAAETDQLSDHLPIIQATHEFVLVNLASFMHYALVLSPKGQYLLTLIDHANKLVPYSIIKQTLKIGNVASMINAMMKVVLAKVSMGTVTNWMGWTKTADEGMNLMQQIISTVLWWDMKDLRSRASKIERDRDGLDKEQLEALKSYLEDKSREQHEQLRRESGKFHFSRVTFSAMLTPTEKQLMSIVAVILSDESVQAPLSEAQHKLALEYLAVRLSIRDREQITKVLCHSKPDHLTESVRDVVAAYEPVIRSVHNAVDLSETLADFERFLRDMLNIARIRQKDDKGKASGEVIAPTVGDFVQLLKNHQTSCHKFLHQCAKNGKEVTRWFHIWALDAAKQFRQPEADTPLAQEGSSTSKGAGVLNKELEALFSSLSSDQQDAFIPILNAHANYLSRLHTASAVRLASVVNSPISDSHTLRHKPYNHLFQSLSRPSSRPPTPTSRSISPTREGTSFPATDTDSGPGAYLARWQTLLDDTAITPATAKGPVRYGRNKDVQHSSKVDVDDENRSHLESDTTKGDYTNLMLTSELGLDKVKKMQRPDVQTVVEALLPAFRDLLAKKDCNW